MNYAFADAPSEVVIDHNSGRSYFGANLQPLQSLKCMFGGRTRYVADGRREFVIDDTSYAVLNRGNPYTIEKRSPSPVETFCLFFPAGWSGDVARTLTLAQQKLLDAEGAPEGDYNLLEHRRPHGDAITRQVLRLKAISSAGRLTDEQLTEDMLRVLRSLLLSEASVRRRIADLPPLRASTRLELFKRAHRGRDFLHAYLDQPVKLSDAARAASMSRYHFLRTFRLAFGVTPHGYLSAQRMERARRLLRTTDLSITEIAALAGFQSLPSFIHRFRKEFAASPSRYRRANEISKVR